MAATKTQRSGSQALIRALDHPLRARLLTIFTERTASPNELARELGEGVSQVAYHVKVLKELDLIELQATKQRRGAIEHFYRAVARPMLDVSEWERIDPLERQAFSGYIVELLIGDSARALETGTMDARENSHLSRTPLLLDEAGFDELATVLEQALQGVLDAQAASSARMAKSGEQGIQTIAGLLGFEVPERRAAGED